MKNSPKKPRSFFYFLLIFVIIVISGWAIFISLLQAPNSSDQSTVTFIIPKGEATQNIAQRLKAEGLIRSPLAFRLALYQQGKQTSIQAGSFKLSPSMSVSELTQVLTKGTDDLWITIPEGWRREEIAASLVKQDLSEFDEQEFLVLTDGLEGQLFPDTYLVPKASTTASIVNLLVNTFESKVLTALAEDLASSQLDLNQILTLASLVQRESANEQDMPLIAGILFNRLEINMPLQVDATLQYVKGYSVAEQTWWSNPVAADKNLASAFNTYQNPGLPPQPICNPGLAAIKAVLHPQSTTCRPNSHGRHD